MKNKDHRICFIGDSFVQGACDPACMGWAGRVAADGRAKGFDISHYNLGIRRNTSRDIAMRWREECAARLPAGFERYAVFSFGVNDTALQDGALRVEAAESLENFRKIVGAASTLYRTLVVGPLPVADPAHNLRTAMLCRQFQQLAAELNVPYLPVFDHLALDADWLAEVGANDGHHPGARGYERMTSLVSGWEQWWFKS